MIKEALKYLIGLSEPNIEEINGDWYSDKELHRIDTYYPKANTLFITTLTGLIDYIESNTDSFSDNMIIEVSSPTKVRMYSSLDNNRDREYLMEVYAVLPDFQFNSFMDQERFCINLQSKFIANKDRDLLLKFAGTVEAGTIAEYGDDGISQKATIKTGIASKGEALIPSPVKLIPYRTFLEVEQPESAFIFRMRDDRGVSCAIFEADGGAWKIEAMQNIKTYLCEKLADKPQFTIVA